MITNKNEMQMLAFDGVNDYLESNTFVQRDRQQAWTFLLHFSDFVQSGTKTVYSSRLVSATRGIYIAISTGVEVVLTGTSTFSRLYFFSAPINANGEHVLQISYDGSSNLSGLRVFLDGLELLGPVYTENTLGTSISSSVCRIANDRSFPTRWRTGKIHHMSFVNRNKTIDEITTDCRHKRQDGIYLFNLSTTYPGTIASPTATTITEQSPAQRVFTIFGQPSPLPLVDSIRREEPSQRVLRFDGVNDYIQMTDFQQFDRFQPWTTQFVIDEYNPLGFLQQFFGTNITGSDAGFVVSGFFGDITVDLYGVNLTRAANVYWTLGLVKGDVFTVSYSGSGTHVGMFAYKNGVLINPSVVLTGLNASIVNGTTATIGRSENRDAAGNFGVPGRYFNGAFKRVSIVNRAKTQAEILFDSQRKDQFGDYLFRYDADLGKGIANQNAPTLDVQDSTGEKTMTIYGKPTPRTQADFGETATAGSFSPTISAIDSGGKEKALFSDGINDEIVFNIPELERTDARVYVADVVDNTSGTLFSTTGFRSSFSMTGINISRLIGSSVPGQIQIYIRSNYSNAIVCATPGGYNVPITGRIVVTYNGSSTFAGVRLYVNGIQFPLGVQHNNLTTTIKNGGNRGYIGRFFSNTLYPLNGSIKQMGMLRGIPTDIHEIFAGGTGGLETYWRLRGGDITSQNFVFTTGQTAQIFGKTFPLSSADTPRFNKARPRKFIKDSILRFDGVNDHTDLAYFPQQPGDVPRTRYMDFALSAYPPTRAGIFSTLDINGFVGGWGFTIEGGGIFRVWLDTSFNSGQRCIVECVNIVPLYARHQVHVVYDGSLLAAGLQIYFNGVLQPFNIIQNNFVLPGTNNAFNAVIGKFSPFGAGFNFSGLIGQCGIYSYMLTQEQIQEDVIAGWADCDYTNVILTAKNVDSVITDTSGNTRILQGKTFPITDRGGFLSHGQYNSAIIPKHVPYLVLDGVNDSVQSPSNNILSGDREWTLDLTLLGGYESVYRGIISRESTTTNRALALFTYNGNYELRDRSTTSSPAPSQKILEFVRPAAGRRHRIRINNVGNDRTIFLDSEQVGAFTSIENYGNKMMIGKCQESPSQEFYGNIIVYGFDGNGVKIEPSRLEIGEFDMFVRSKTPDQTNQQIQGKNYPLSSSDFI